MMIRLFFLQLFLLGPTVLVPAQQVDYSEVDQWVSNQRLEDTSIVEFTRELTSRASNDFEKIRAIYQFVIHHVSYEDDVPQKANKRTNRTLYDIVRRKKGICWDYSLLIAEMSKIVGLECTIVSGWGRDISKVTDLGAEPNHAWNIVLLDSNYYLLDATWSSNTTENLDEFQRIFQTGYFLTPPNLFIVNHFPALPLFQLLDPPVAFSSWKENSDPGQSNVTLQNETRDSINSFLGKSKVEQRSIEAEAAYASRPGTKTQAAYGHALFDQAIFMKDSADLHLELKNTSQAIPQYRYAISLFEKASALSRGYPWQREAQAFCHLNLAQALYRVHYEKGRAHLTPVAEELRSAQKLLGQLDTASFIVQSARRQIEKQLQAIE